MRRLLLGLTVLAGCLFFLFNEIIYNKSGFIINNFKVESAKNEKDKIEEFSKAFDDYLYVNNPLEKVVIDKKNPGIYDLEPYLAGLLSMYEATQNVSYINYALKKTETIMLLMEDVDNDGYYEWLGGQDSDNNPLTPSRAYCLHIERGIRQVARMARIIKNDKILNKAYGDRADKIVHIVEYDVVNNPYCRDRFQDYYLTTHDAVSHPVMILLELYLINGNKDYLNIISSQAKKMKDSFFKQPSDLKAVVWGTTLCKDIDYKYPLCYYISEPDKTYCKDSAGHDYCYPSDVSHAENFIFVAIELYRANIVFTKEDIDTLIYTFKNKVWNKDKADPKFYDFLDGKLLPIDATRYSQWTMGSNIAPGWVGLGAFDSETQGIMESVQYSENTNKKWLNYLAYYGELAKNYVAKDCRYTNDAKEVCDGNDNDCDGRIDEGGICK